MVETPLYTFLNEKLKNIREIASFKTKKSLKTLIVFLTIFLSI
ncbi:hypothetical protein D920_00429 [Enterococcus faecalis 13-SD-W-01]|nr:hypothetical protein D920_00429 [Enterococcus faecalis 13-SD-W-01]